METLQEPFLLEPNTAQSQVPNSNDQSLSQSSNGVPKRATLINSLRKTKSEKVLRAARMSSFRAETRKETGGCGVWPEFKHRQQWKLRKDGVTYENTGRHEERNARWMDIFFDLGRNTSGAMARGCGDKKRGRAVRDSV